MQCIVRYRLYRLGLFFIMALALFSGTASHSAHAASLATPHLKRYRQVSSSLTPPGDSDCRAKYHMPCYSPQEIRNAYGLTQVLNDGIQGATQTIVIIDSFGSPTLRHDLHVFDKGYGLPDPPSLKVLAPLGTVPFDPNNGDQVGWATETTLDVEWAHAIAPAASLVVLTSPVSETEGVQGLPEFLQLEQYAVTNKLGKIFSQSWAATEDTLSTTPQGKVVLDSYNAFYQLATQRDHISILSSSGDSGAANVDVNGKVYPYATVNFPASSPWVTAVGGTSLEADTDGNYIHEVTWNEGKDSATGGGVSSYFSEPDYQTNALTAPLNTMLQGRRGLPDIAYNGDPETSILIYASIPGLSAGYYFIGGTSEGAPQWAGIVALANQKAGHAIGFLNPILYRLGSSQQAGNYFHDIRHGNNAQPDYNVGGYGAGLGWDAVTGWGTPKGADLITALGQ